MPSKFFASGLDSSNQFDVFVASLVATIWAERSAANVVVERSSVLDLGALFDEAVTMVFFLRLFTLRPSSSVDV